ncbi:MAG TPA: peptidoglycan DD-metalloendopeptidase family protein, partial [Luteimonas sp.]|nr:peptidoglycan DD-metalloendopeptidase family protein [Luteimonas sp.]
MRARRMTGIVRAIALLAVALLLAACGSSHVVREYGTRSGKPVRVSTPRYGAAATVQRGQTLYRIATDNGISALDLAVWNNIAPPYTIYPGQRLRLYPGGAARQAVSSAVAPPRRAVATTRSVTPAPVAATPEQSPFAWRWPVDGQLIGRYVPGEPTQQGIDVAGNAGAPVRAAADGVVVYSGSGLVGYGELIIIKHNDQWLSAYGHNRSRMVNEGQIVKAGQQIAEMGHSGAARDMLHFEIRYNGKPVDPLQYLP